MHKQDMTNNNRMFSVFLMIVFIALYFVALSFPDKSAIYPKGLLIVGMICVTAMFIGTFIGKNDEEKKVFINRDELIKLIISIALMILYVILLTVLGYAVSTFIYMLIQIWVLKPEKKISYLIVALVSTTILYVGFGIFLKIWLPKGLFF
ncbi:MAG: tripartite tricarboxylate transporter TctB family protein [Tissierellia bacterium]|nr:tripartite tricarboxylate transporter TctB family protein [Tissierellia bacterium]